MNNVVLMGRLARDPISRVCQTQNGDMETSAFTLAVDRNKKKEEGETNADFISCKAFGKTAEVINKYFSKGSRILILGRIQTGSYDNKDGQKVYTTDVMVEKVEFCESKSSNTNNSSAPSDNFVNVPDSLEDEGLPFK